jgi:Lhr-like helicase
LFASMRRAWPYRTLERRDFDAVLATLAEGTATARGRTGAYLHRDAVNRMVRGRRGARLTAITSGGAIPDASQYLVVAEPEGTTVGMVDEDFASCWGPPRGASAASRPGGCAWRTRTERRPTSPSGAARRPAEPKSFPAK